MQSGEAGSDSSLLIRFYRKFFQQGTPVGPFRFVTLAPPSGPAMPFCILTQTKKDRLCLWHLLPAGSGMLTPDGKKGLADHFTLEFPSTKTHLTTQVGDKKKSHHADGWRLDDFCDTGWSFWLSMIAPLALLRSQELQVERWVKMPNTDAERRKAEFAESAKKMGTLRLAMPEQTAGDYFAAAFYVRSRDACEVELPLDLFTAIADWSNMVTDWQEPDPWEVSTLAVPVGTSHVLIAVATPPGSFGGEPMVGFPHAGPGGPQA